jgi:hypothetical protein
MKLLKKLSIILLLICFSSMVYAATCTTNTTCVTSTDYFTVEFCYPEYASWITAAYSDNNSGTLNDNLGTSGCSSGCRCTSFAGSKLGLGSDTVYCYGDPNGYLAYTGWVASEPITLATECTTTTTFAPTTTTFAPTTGTEYTNPGNLWIYSFIFPALAVILTVAAWHFKDNFLPAMLAGFMWFVCTFTTRSILFTGDFTVSADTHYVAAGNPEYNWVFIGFGITMILYGVLILLIGLKKQDILFGGKPDDR